MTRRIESEVYCYNWSLYFDINSDFIPSKIIKELNAFHMEGFNLLWLRQKLWAFNNFQDKFWYVSLEEIHNSFSPKIGIVSLKDPHLSCIYLCTVKFTLLGVVVPVWTKWPPPPQARDGMFSSSQVPSRPFESSPLLFHSPWQPLI